MATRPEAANKLLEGAYVAAWVWVGVEEGTTNGSITDAEFRTRARHEYEQLGSVEIGSHAEVSRSFIGG